VHKGISPDTLEAQRRAHPDAEVLVHPECGCAGQVIYAMGRGDISPDRVHIASTERMIQLTRERPAREFIIATETGIMHRMQQTAPDKTFLAADPEAVCAYMKTITLPRVRDALVLDQFEITVPGDIAERAKLSLERMVSLGR
jgi:quinolinate synthase